MAHDPHQPSDPNTVELPTPTAWPVITAFGITLMFFGLVTNFFISFIGFVTALVGAVGWFSDVFPHPKHEPFPIRPKDQWPKEITSHGRSVSHLHVGEHGHREQFPEAVHPYTAGIVGGLAGGAAMAAVACLWGVFVNGSVWYPINLLAAMGVAELAELALTNVEKLKEFSLVGLVVGVLVHVTTSVLMGLLYTIILPMLPLKREWLVGGTVIPIIWTGMIWATLRFINPALNAHIEWIPFWISQFAFGLVCGYLVFRSAKMSTMQGWTVAARLGVEAQRPGDKQS